MLLYEPVSSFMGWLVLVAIISTFFSRFARYLAFMLILWLGADFKNKGRAMAED